MKEATGELNMTVVTVVAIAAVAAFFYAFIWPGIQQSIKASTYCATAYGCDSESKNCRYTDSTGKEANGLDCSKYLNNGSGKTTGTGTGGAASETKPS